MRRYGMYDATRGLTIALAAGLAGLLLYLAAQVGQQSTLRFWESMGIVAAAGLVLGLARLVGGWTSGLRLRFSPGTFLLGFLPVLVVVGWILLATQPGNGWHEGRLVGWSESLGVMGAVHAIGLFHGVLAFGLGYLLGACFDAVPVEAPVERAAVVDDRPVVERRSPVAADEPLTAERRTAEPTTETTQPRVATVGPRRTRVD